MFWRTSLMMVLWWGSLTVLPAQIALIRDQHTPLFEMPSTTSRQVATLFAGDTVYILQNRGMWLQLVTRENLKGWMYLGKVEGQEKKARPPLLFTVPEPAVKGGISLQAGVFDQAGSGLGRIAYRWQPRLEIEATLQYAARKAVSRYLLHGNARYFWPLKWRCAGWLTAGAGAIHSEWQQAGGREAQSHLMVNYGLGVQHHLGGNKWLRADGHRYTLLNKSPRINYVGVVAGFTIGLQR